MLIRCIYADAIYLVAIFWLTPLLVFVVFCLPMQVILVCYTQLSRSQTTHLHNKRRRIYYQPPSAVQENIASTAHAEVSGSADERSPRKPKEQHHDPPSSLRSLKVFCLLASQLIVTFTMLPFLTFQLFDLMNVPSDPLMFWLSDSGRLTLCILQSLPMVHFAVQPFLMMCMASGCTGRSRHVSVVRSRQDHTYNYTFSNNTCVITSI